MMQSRGNLPSVHLPAHSCSTVWVEYYLCLKPYKGKREKYKLVINYANLCISIDRKKSKQEVNFPLNWYDICIIFRHPSFPIDITENNVSIYSAKHRKRALDRQLQCKQSSTGKYGYISHSKKNFYKICRNIRKDAKKTFKAKLFAKSRANILHSIFFSFRVFISEM